MFSFSPPPKSGNLYHFFWTSKTTFWRVLQNKVKMITTMIIVIIILVLLMIFGVKNDQKVSHNMILMSKYKGQHGGKKGQKIRAGVSPPPLFGQCPKENIFFFRRASLREAPNKTTVNLGLDPNVQFSHFFLLLLVYIMTKRHVYKNNQLNK